PARWRLARARRRPRGGLGRAPLRHPPRREGRPRRRRPGRPVGTVRRALLLAGDPTGVPVPRHPEAVPLAALVPVRSPAVGALLPDMDLSGRVTTDQGGATVAHTFGVISLFVAECVEKLSLGIYDLTRTRRDPRRDNGHRTFTHTLPFTAGVGVGVFELCLH